MKKLICFLIGHKHRKKSRDRIFISSLCMRCYSFSTKVDYSSQKFYFSDGAEKRITKWDSNPNLTREKQ